MTRIAVDWAGDPGVKRGSHPRCIMVVVACADDAALHTALAQLRSARHLRPDFEFHSTRLTAPLREAFMQAVADQPFTARVAIYEKALMRASPVWGRDRDLLVHLIARCTLALSADTLQKSTMVIDGKEEITLVERHLRPALSRALCRQGRAERLAKITHGDSATHAVIQLADMIAGAVARACDEQREETAFLEPVRRKVTIERITPEMEKPIE